MGTNINPFGLLAYGDNDPINPVVWRSSMRSQAAISTPEIGGGTFSIAGATNVFDANIGYNGGGLGSITISNVLNNTKLNGGGQLTFTLEQAMISCLPATCEGSTGGRAQTLAESFVGFVSSAASGGNHQISCYVSAKLLAAFVGDGITSFTLGGYSADVAGKTDKLKVTLAWSANYFSLFYNGKHNSSGKRVNNLLNPYNTLVFGGYPFAPTANPLTTGFISDVQVSAKPLLLSTPYMLGNFVLFGDSYMDTSPIVDIGKTYAMEGVLNEMGLKPIFSPTQTFPGRRVIGSGNPLSFLKDNVATALTFGGSTTIFQAGANDLTFDGTLNVAAFTASMRDMIAQFFGQSGYPATKTRYMVVCTTPWAPEHPTAAQAEGRKADILSIQSIMLALPAWFDATYPSLAGRLVCADVFKYYGGFNVPKSYYGVTDKLHPSPEGGWYMGKCWAEDGILKLLRAVQ